MGYEPRIVGIQLTETGQQQNFFPPKLEPKAGPHCWVWFKLRVYG